MPPLNHSPFPSALQETLMKAALFEGDSMLQAWHEWKQSINLEADIEQGSMRLLPLLFFNLHCHGVQDPLLSRIKGVYRKAWSKNQFIFSRAARVLTLLNASGIPTMLLKGIPLTFMAYKNQAVRPMHDVDVMVPFSQALQALQTLKDHGWKLSKPHLEKFYLKYGRSMAFVDTDNNELDLHWHPIYEARGSDRNNDFWDRAVGFEVAGVHTLSLCPADMLLHTIVHGLRCNDEPPIRWVPDAIFLIRMQDPPVDWERLIEGTLKYHVPIQMREALKYLCNTFHAPVPEDILAKLSAMKADWASRLVYRHAMRIGERTTNSFYERLLTIYVNHVRQSTKRNFVTVHIRFVRYVLRLAAGRSFYRLLSKYFLLLFKRNKQYA